MASSDEEGEILPDCITNYHFVDSKEEPVSFSILPFHWSEDEMPDNSSLQIFLRGSADDGLRQIYKKVMAWKFELSFVLPEIYVLSKDKAWIKLQRPRKSFEDIVKTILITVHCLHFVKKNPEASGDALWNHLLKSFSSYEVEPSKNDILHHMLLISEAAKRDKDIEKSEYLVTLILDMPGKKVAPCEEIPTRRKSKFVVDADDYDGDDYDDNDECDEDKEDLFDSVCAFCDNGGEVLCCEGRCFRSFHATIEAGIETQCESLGYTDAQVDAIQNFHCANCQHQQHQCFACGMLGSSNKSSGAEVFSCANATCGNFYHPKCIAKLLLPLDEAQAEELQKQIALGESFTCPAHKCFVCKQLEDKKVWDLQFAMCRRCPKAYHRKCLPRNILYQPDNDKNIPQRAWDFLFPNRILIYCMNHKIIRGLLTPKRNHLTFPDVDRKEKQQASTSLSSKEKVVMEKLRTASHNLTERNLLKVQNQVAEAHISVKGVDSTKNTEKGFSRQPFSPKINELTGKFLRGNDASDLQNGFKSSTADKSKSVLRNDQSNLKWKSGNSNSKTKIVAKPMLESVICSRPLVDAEMEKRIVALMKKSSSSFHLEEFVKKQKTLSGTAYSKNVMDKTITKGKVEGSVKAVRTALKKLEEGCTLEDAIAICEPEILDQITRWKRKLQIYLAPFLHGLRYTSFGRHFTKMDKLKEIVDRLHGYVQDGDMIVDFCCGSNDFSCIMNEKLDKMGKRCSFMNYDLIPPKNDFNFEKRDWMKVQVGELPQGSRLIMGLNPPFGVHASLANKFIDQALKFRPKLLILIVPRETERLDEKDLRYDIIWEDDKLLSGKSFYLPGSVDTQNQQLEDWNLDAPPLYLWSRPDWTAKHRVIAQKHGHLYGRHKEMHAEKDDAEAVSNYLMEENLDCYGDFSNIVSGCGDISNILDDIPEDLDDAETKGMFVPDGHENKKPKIGKLDNEGPLQSDEMCLDMELSMPNESPYNNAVRESMFSPNSYGALETSPKISTVDQGLMYPQPSIYGHQTGYNRALDICPKISTADQGLMYSQPSIYGHQTGYGTEYSGLYTTFPNATESGCNGTYKGACPTWSTSTVYGLNGRSLCNPFVDYGRDNVEHSVEESNGRII